MFEPFISVLKHAEVLRIQPGDDIREDLGALSTSFFLCGVIPDGREIKLPTKIYTSKDTQKNAVDSKDFINAIVVLTDKNENIIKCELYELSYFLELYEPNERKNWQIDQFESDDSSAGFEWAMVHLKEGRCVRRSAWDDNSVFVTVTKDNNNCIIKPIEILHRDSLGNVSEWLPTKEDLSADDWQVIWQTLGEENDDSTGRFF